MFVGSFRHLGFRVLILVFGVFLFGAAVDMWAAERLGVVKGRLLDAETRRPLSGAEVRLLGTALTAVTAGDGAFAFPAVPVGGYTLEFSYPDIVPLRKPDIIVKSGLVTFVTVEMGLLAVISETVKVTPGCFAPPRETAVGTMSFSSEEIRRNSGTAGDVSRIISGLPAVAKTDDSTNALVVRGGSPLENSFFIDNIEVPNINHFPSQGSGAGPIGLVNVDFIQDVTFYPGGFPVVYGDRLSSVMAMTFREGNRERCNGQFSLDMGGAGVSGEGPLPGGKGSWLVSARRSYLDLMTRIVGEDTLPDYSDFQGKIVWEAGKRHKFTLLGLAGIDNSGYEREAALDKGETYYGPARHRENTVGINWLWLWGSNGYAETSLSRSENRYRYDWSRTVSGMPAFANHSAETGFTLRHLAQWSFGHGHKLRWGTEVKRLETEMDYALAPYIDSFGNAVPGFARSLRRNAWKYAGFFSYMVRPLRTLSLDVGVRFARFSATDAVTVSPRLSLVWNVSDTSSLTAAAGLFHQDLPPSLLYQYAEHGSLAAPRARHLGLEFQRMLSGDTRLTVSAYHKEYDRLPMDPGQPAVFPLDEAVEPGFFRSRPLVGGGRARAWGAEFILQKRLKSKVYGMVSGAWSRSRYRDLSGVWRDRSGDNRWIVSLEGGYKPDRRWEFSLRWIYAGGLPYTPFDEAASREARTGIFSTDINGRRLPAYHSLNLRVDRRFHFRRSNLILYLSLWNAYNRRNVSHFFWNEMKNTAERKEQWGVLPLLGVEFEF